jgi:hypothetical protein
MEDEWQKALENKILIAIEPLLENIQHNAWCEGRDAAAELIGKGPMMLFPPFASANIRAIKSPYGVSSRQNSNI